MTLDSLLAVIVLLAFWRGLRRGLVSALLGLAGLVASYVASLILFRPIGELVQTELGVAPPLSYGVAGLGFFLLLNFLFFLADLLRRSIFGGRGPLSRLDRTLGGVLGLALGGLAGFFVLVCVGLLPEGSTAHEFLEVERSRTMHLARPLARAALHRFWYALVGDSRDAAMLERMSHRTGDLRPALAAFGKACRTLLQDEPDLREAFLEGGWGSIRDDPRVLALLESPSAQELGRQLAPPEASAEEAYQAVRRGLDMLDRLSRNSRLAELLQDGELAETLRQGQKWARP